MTTNIWIANDSYLVLPKQVSAKYEIQVMMYISVQLMKTGISLNVFVNTDKQNWSKNLQRLISDWK